MFENKTTAATIPAIAKIAQAEIGNPAIFRFYRDCRLMAFGVNALAVYARESPIGTVPDAT